MTCPEFEELLLDYDKQKAQQRSTVDAHVSACESCRTLQSALAEVDTRLEREYPAIQASPVFDNRVHARIRTLDAAVRKPSLLPELLDFVGYLSVTAALLVTLVLLFPNVTSFLTRLTLNSPATIGAEIVVVMMAIGFGIKVYSDIRPDSH